MPFLLILGDMEEPTTVEGFPFGDLLLRSGERLNPLNEVVRKWRRVLGANRRMKQTKYGLYKDMHIPIQANQIHLLSSCTTKE